MHVHVLIRRAMPLLWPQVGRDVSDEGMLDWMLPDVQGRRILRCVRTGVALVQKPYLLLQRPSLHECLHVNLHCS